MIIQQVISGGQSGCDISALVAAKANNIPTGGWAPKGWLTEAGPQERVLRSFGLEERQLGRTFSERMRARTWANVDLCDAVVILGRKSPGSNLTRRFAGDLGKPWLWWEWTERKGWVHPSGNSGGMFAGPVLSIDRFIRRHSPDCLMVAGNRSKKNPGIGPATRALMSDVLRGLE